MKKSTPICPKHFALSSVVVIAALLVSPSAPAQTYTILHTFTGPDGASPGGPLIRDAAGNLYGSTYYGGNGNLCGGTVGCGTVFKLSPSGVETLLYTFSGGADGAFPRGLFRDAAGNLYGLASQGGNLSLCNLLGFPPGCGVIFKLSPPATVCRSVMCPWSETVLHTFTGPDGEFPIGSLIQDSAGNFYGVTVGGGSGDGEYYNGTVFELNSAGQETVLLNFESGQSGGDTPLSGVVQDSAGMLYGTTHYGGTGGYGVVYKLNPTSGQETVLYSFRGVEDGAYPNGPLVFDQAANIYGSTEWGGFFQGDGQDCYAGCGVIYKLDANGDENVLYTFTGGADGWWPSEELTRDSAGNLYGITFAGGNEQAGGCNPGGCGTVFKLDTNGNKTVLHAFDSTDGADPGAGLIQDAAGNLYGTTSAGGGDGNSPIIGGCGVVFKITP